MLKKILISCALFFVAGCGMETDNTAQKESNNPQQISNETPKKEDKEYYPDARILQKERLSDNDFSNYTDPYTDEVSQKVAKELMENRDIVMAEVHNTDEQIFVAVMLRENVHDRNHDMSIVTDIEEDVRSIIDDKNKQITVLTDHIQWNRMKNHHSSPEGLNFFDEFFETDD